MRSSYEVIEIDNYIILNTLQNFHFLEYFIFVYKFGLKTCRTKYRQNIKDQHYFDYKILNLNWSIVKSSIFLLKK